MKYRYLYQTKTNENRDGWVVAKNRAEAYASLRKQGIRPYRLIGDDPIRWQPWAIGGVIAGLVILLVAVLVLWRPQTPETLPVRRAQLAGDPAVVSEGIACGWVNVFPDSELDRLLAAYAQPGWIAMPPEFDEEALARLGDAVAKEELPEAAIETGPEVRQLRGIVRQMRQEMRDYLAAGGTVRDYIVFLETRQDEETSFRNQAIDSVQRTPDPLRERARISMNIRLRERGLLEIDE